MKAAFLICAVSFLGLTATAQCDRNIIYNSGKVDFADSLGKSRETKEGKITIRLTKKDFVLVHDDDEDDALKGPVENLTCEWQDPFKNGKTTFESELEEKSGEKYHAMVSIDGKDGHLLIQVMVKEKDMLLKIIPESYTEGKE